jgi:hypothetical protein
MRIFLLTWIASLLLLNFSTLTFAHQSCEFYNLDQSACLNQAGCKWDNNLYNKFAVQGTSLMSDYYSSGNSKITEEQYKNAQEKIPEFYKSPLSYVLLYHVCHEMSCQTISFDQLRNSRNLQDTLKCRTASDSVLMNDLTLFLSAYKGSPCISSTGTAPTNAPFNSPSTSTPSAAPSEAEADSSLTTAAKYGIGFGVIAFIAVIGVGLVIRRKRQGYQSL